jgi:hypothetical protein
LFESSGSTTLALHWYEDGRKSEFWVQLLPKFAIKITVGRAVCHHGPTLHPCLPVGRYELTEANAELQQVRATRLPKPVKHYSAKAQSPTFQRDRRRWDAMMERVGRLLVQRLTKKVTDEPEQASKPLQMGC